MDRRVGLIGVGSMGAGVAGNLVAAGFPLGVYDRDSQRRRAAKSRGAIPFDSQLELAAWTDLLLLSLPGPTEVAEVVLGTDGLAFVLPPDSMVVNLSTISPRLARELSEVASARRIDVLDAPVTGAIDGAVAGRLTIMVGGELHVLERARAVLEPLGTVIHTGPVGTGSAAKLLTNMLWFIHVVALAEALALGVHEGLGPGLLGDIVRASAGGSWVADHDLQNILRGEDDRSFTLALCCKDLRLLNELATDRGLRVTSLAASAALFAEARDRFGDSEGELAVTRLVEESAAVSIRNPTVVKEGEEVVL